MAIGKTYVDGLVNVLVELGIVPIQEALAIKQSFSASDQHVFDHFMIDEGLVSREDLLRAVAKYYTLPSFDVVGYFFDHQLLHNFPKDFLLRNAIIPVQMDGDDMLIMVASEPDLPNLVEHIGVFSSSDIIFYVGLQHDICDAIKEFYDESLTQEIFDRDVQEERNLAQEEHRLEESDDEKID